MILCSRDEVFGVAVWECRRAEGEGGEPGWDERGEGIGRGEGNRKEGDGVGMGLEGKGGDGGGDGGVMRGMKGGEWKGRMVEDLGWGV